MERAVYFASEAALTGRFWPASLLQSEELVTVSQPERLKNTEILKDCTEYGGKLVTEETIDNQMNHIRSLMKCVEDHKLEAEISINSLNKQLSLLGKVKAAKKKGKESPNTSNKRARSERPRRRDRPPRSEKRTKYPSYSKREAASPVVDPVSKYLGTHNLSSQSAYDPGFTASTYGKTYGASLVPSANQITHQHYGVPSGSAPCLSVGPRPSGYVVPGGSVPSQNAGPHLGNSFGLQNAYGAYDYGATTASTYQPPPYAP